MKFYSQKYMLDLYAQLSRKRHILCIAREEDSTGKRLYFVVDIEKFMNFYLSMTNLHYYEVILYFVCFM